jgi:hypothetical protein
MLMVVTMSTYFLWAGVGTFERERLLPIARPSGPTNLVWLGIRAPSSARRPARRIESKAARQEYPWATGSTNFTSQLAEQETLNGPCLGEGNSTLQREVDNVNSHFAAFLRSVIAC